MPRVLVDGPALATSPDGALVAVLDRGRLTLVDVAGRNEVAEATVPVSGIADVAFVEKPTRLVAVTRLAESTHLHAFAVPSLELLAMLEIPTPLRALAFVGERVLLVADDGDGESARLVTLSRKTLSADLIALRGPVHVAAAAPEDRLLVESRGQLEFWDVMLKRALFRLNLPLPQAVQAIGFAGRGRLLWVGSSTGHGHFEVFRFSDGRRQLQVDLGAPLVAVEGSAISNRILVAQRASAAAPVTLIQIDLGAREQQSLDVLSPIGGFAMVEGEQPVVVIAATGVPLTFLSLSRATGSARIVSLGGLSTGAVEEPAPRRAADSEASPDAAAAEAASQAASAADRFAAWRSRLQGARTVAAGSEEVAPAGDGNEAAIEIAPSIAEVAEPRPTPTADPGTAAARFSARAALRRAASPSTESGALVSPSSNANFPSRIAARTVTPRSSEATHDGPAPAPAVTPPRRWASPAIRSERPVTPPRSASAPIARAVAAPRKRIADTSVSLTANDAAESWRARLVAWGREALEGEEVVTLPALEGTPIEQLQIRFALDPSSLRILALLYASWLGGDARDGLAIARAAQLADEDGQGQGWIESLGRGALARAGIVRVRRGRLRLRTVAGRFLDGQPAQVSVVPSTATSEDEPAALSVMALEGESPSDVAPRLAERLGRAVAWISLDGNSTGEQRIATLANGLFEARVIGAVALVSGLPTGGIDHDRWMARLEGAVVVLAVEAIAPSVAHLPTLY